MVKLQILYSVDSGLRLGGVFSPKHTQIKHIGNMKSIYWEHVHRLSLEVLPEESQLH